MENNSSFTRFAYRLRMAFALLLRGDSETQRSDILRRALEIPPISAEEVADAKHFFPLDKYFIFGHARSGTTLLTRLVRLHPEVHCNYQGHFFTRPPLLHALVIDPDIRSWLARRSNRWNRGKDLSPAVLRAVSDFIMENDAHKVGKHIVGDKSPNSLLDGDAVQLLVNIYPDARLIYIVRDGRDVAVSHRFQTFIENPHTLSASDTKILNDFTRNPDLFLNGQRSIFSEKAIRLAAKSWVKNVDETDRAARDKMAERYLSLRYEDLLEQPHREMHKVWSFLGANPEAEGLDAALDVELDRNPDADWQKHKAGEMAGALEKGKAGSWKNLFTPRDRQVFIELAGGALKSWGYTV